MLIFISELRIDRDKNKSQNPKLANEYSTKALSALVFFAGTVLVLSAAILALAKRFKIVRKFISIPILEFSKRSSMAIGIMLLILSKGIYDKVKTAYKSTIILLILGALLTFVKGLDFEEAIILIIISLLLFLSKDSFLDELKEISDEWLGPREEKGFSIGWFDREYLNRSPIAIIRHDNKVIAFTNLMPLYDEETMSIDLMRSNNNIPSGTMDALFIELMEWSKAQGYNKFNLGMAPLSNVGVNPYSANLEKLIKNLYQRGNKIYSFSGLRKYKEKFQPRWESRYLAYPKDANISILLLQIVMLTSKSRKI